MSTKRVLRLGTPMALVGLVIFAVLVWFFATGGVRGQEDTLPEAVAVEKAKAEARFAGLQGEPSSPGAVRGQEDTLSEEVAVEKAKAEARFAGLQGEPSSPGVVSGQEDTLSEDVAVEKAKAEARFAGLQGEPTSYEARRMTLAEYDSLARRGKLGKDAAAVGQYPNMLVWVVLFRGDVRLSLPGLPPPGGYGARQFDNLMVALNARTGEVVGRDAYPPGRPVPVMPPAK